LRQTPTTLDPLAALAMMMRIRAFEDVLVSRRDHGFQLLSAGEEAVAVGLCAALHPRDALLSGGRSIAAALARGLDPHRVMAELLGKSAGTNQGRGGRGHLADPDTGFFGAHAVVAGNISVAAGVALAKQLDHEGAIVAVLFGDGACGAGVLHETLNMAANWKLPLLFVCSNNQLSVSTARSDALAPAQLSDLAATFGLSAQTIDGLDVQGVAEAVTAAVRSVRSGGGPAFIECLSIRLRSHSTTARESRTPEMLAQLTGRCPIARQVARLGLPSCEVEKLESSAREAAQAALAYADAAPCPDPSEVLNHVG
jgi:TPP-dependent pyruvate/acetoin dehydrogenase alpha subunit